MRCVAIRTARLGTIVSVFSAIIVCTLVGGASAEPSKTGANPDQPEVVIPFKLPGSSPEATSGIAAYTNSLFPSVGAKWLNPTPGMYGSAPQTMPFPPHRATTASRSLTPEQFDNSMVCATCHQDIHRQWSESVMGKSWDDPIYRALLKRASIATKGKVDNFCTGCHTPTGLTTGQINSEINRESPELAAKQNRVLAGVDCESCHNISRLTGLDNGAYVLTPRNNVEGLPQKYGPRSDAVSPYHKTVYSELHIKSEFCAACHNVTHPFSSTPIERTFDEWQESPFNANNQNCQSCHMPAYRGKSAVLAPSLEGEEDKPRVEPKERKDIAAHYFAGGNTTLLEHFGLKASAQRSREMLRRSAKVEITCATGAPVG
ncbi:MAG TPA: multiheme c-type cytochrome, partial [Verrucomicrobiae bacterium]